MPDVPFFKKICSGCPLELKDDEGRIYMRQEPSELDQIARDARWYVLGDRDLCPACYDKLLVLHAVAGDDQPPVKKRRPKVK
jgi:hypothetical protein